ncbi:MAG TPA: alpha/beta family hydrolase [Thermodesulfobacteriota bacterium]|nr:alpha/beta family hydrolase [Thermodesulfobacteriota bacterium]
MKEEKIFIPSDGIQLEGLLSIQEAPSFRGGVICSHPHPQFGGEMSHPVVTTASEVAWQEGYSTLRFNFRGVGESGGSYGEGVGERQDVKAAANYFDSRLRGGSPLLVLVGYSFGAWAGFPVAVEDERFVGMAAIAPPLEIYDFGFLKGCKKRKLFISGDRDSFCPPSLLERWYQQLEEPKSLTLIQGADHFLFSHIHFLIQPLKEFLRTLRG